MAEWIDAAIEKYGVEAPRFIRTMGTPLSADERKALKLGNLKMSREAWSALTDLGRQEPAQSYELTIQRAMFAATRGSELDALLQDPNVADIEVRAWDGCSAMATFRADTPVIPKAAAPWLPLPGCERAVCRCQYARHYKTSTFEMDDMVDAISPEPVAIADKSTRRQRGLAETVARLIWHGFAVYGAIALVYFLLASR
jgi:hypothetical protein